jgi:glyoxylase-like metal-dependent hydrolase (beta-lactamase superfamily II)
MWSYWPNVVREGQSGEAGDVVPDGIARVRAANSGPLTLSGTNTYLAGRPAWVIDPGPAEPQHLERVWSEAEARGGIAGVALTHRHLDHAESAPVLSERSGAPLAAGPPPQAVQDGRFREPDVPGLVPDVVLREGDSFGPLEVLETPGHSSDHLCFLAGTVLFCGDTVLGEGSVFIPPGGGSLGSYLASLRKLERLELTALCPGHGPVVWKPHAKIAEYIAHRLERERRLVAALERGLRRRDELLDDVWDDAPPELRPAAALTLEAHLDKLAGEHRLPAGVERM